MTTPAGTGAADDGHLGLDALAELDEGLLPDDRAARARAHLSGCAACRDRHGALRATRALLTTLPAEPMPAAVAARIDDVLDQAAVTTPTVVPLERARRRWMHHPTLPGLAATFTALALISAVVYGVVHKKGTSQPPNHGAPGGASALSAEPSFPITNTGHDYTKANVTALVPELLRTATATSSSGAGSSGGVPGAAAPRTGTPPGAVTATGPSQSSIPTQLARLFGSRTALRACINALTAGGPPQTPLAVDFGSYNGNPAVIVVLPGIVATNVDAWIVGPACGTTSENLLLYESLPRPSG